MLNLIVLFSRRLVKVCSSIFTKALLKEEGIKFGKNLIVIGIPIIEKFENSNITLGENIILCSKDYSNPLGLNHRTIIRTLSNEAKISIGNDVGISGGSICAFKEVKIGNNVMLGANVQISDSDFHSLTPLNRRYNKNEKDILCEKIIIHNNVWIGANSIILKGVTIGENSIIGAGSVVTTSIPENTIAAGVPAKVIRSL